MAVPQIVQKNSPDELRDRPVLLPMASYHGTLAAVRSLGSAGLQVTLAESNRFVPAVWSRFAASRVRSPSPEENPTAFIEWLMKFGERQPGYVLYPTSDDVAWLYAWHRDQLARHFVLRYPDEQTTYSLLNKTRLRLLAEQAGLRMPHTWIPAGARDLAKIEREARFPVVVKPQTQVLLRPHAKGVTVDRASDLRHAYEAFIATTRYSPTLLAHDPGVCRATVQEYFKAASEDVYGITGFIDDTGRFAARASRKILQHPRRLGVGLCFEEAELDAGLLAKVIELCRRARFHGVFEAEFVADRGTPLLIDFNPRFYGQMAFDVARGLPQALLAYEWTLGRSDRVERLLASAGRQRDARARVYCRERDLKLLLVLRRLAGTMSRNEATRWWRWLAEHRGSLVDAVSDPDDRRPASVEVLHNLSGWLRHPRSFFRQWMFD